MIAAYMIGVVRDRAAHRGCTGGGHASERMGPPGAILGGFSFLRDVGSSPGRDTADTGLQ